MLAGNLAVMAVAWLATGLALHQLLTHFDDRTAALVATHKKFLVSRLADVCLWGALALVHHVVGSLDLAALDAWAAAHATLPPAMHLAATLRVLAAALKSAQLPFHGWLMQVMEAPTPVSALLHAGVVNLGGFLMIRLAPLMARAPAAQLLLVAIGTTTAVLAALVVRTRVSVKVALAWSTCAQMGFMLVECGLGAWHLALLHLIAHSLYKAHAFLAAGGTVDVWRERALTPARPVALGAIAASTATTLAVILTPTLALLDARRDPTVIPLAAVVALSLAPMMARAASGPPLALTAVALRALGAAALYAAWHAVAGSVRVGPAHATPSAVAWAVFTAGFLTLFVAQAWLDARPGGALARALHPWLFAGFFLGERFTRWTFFLWPLPRPRSPTSPHPIPLSDSL